MRFLSQVIFLFLLFPLSGFATVISADIQKDRIVIAADSRQQLGFEETSPFVNTGCKITVAHDKFVIAFAGSDYYPDTTQELLKMAPSYFNSPAISTSAVTKELTEFIHAKGDMSLSVLNSNPSWFAGDVSRGFVVMVAWFEQSEPRLLEGRVLLSSKNGKLSYSARVESYSYPNFLTESAGVHEIYDPEVDRWMNEHLDPRDFLFNFTRLVGSKHPQDVGGPTDIVQITAGQLPDIKELKPSCRR